MEDYTCQLNPLIMVGALFKNKVELKKVCQSLTITVKTVTLGGFHLKLIFDNGKLKILVFASFSPRRYNLSIVKGSFCRYASGLVALQSTCRCRRFTVGFTAGNVG